MKKHRLSKQLSHKCREKGIPTRFVQHKDELLEAPQHITKMSDSIWGLRIFRASGHVYQTLSAKNGSNKAHLDAIQQLTAKLIKEALPKKGSTLKTVPSVTYRQHAKRMELTLFLWGRSAKSSNPKAKSVTFSVNANVTDRQLDEIEHAIACLWQWRLDTTENYGLEALRNSVPPTHYEHLTSTVAFSLDRDRIKKALGIETHNSDFNQSFSFGKTKKECELAKALKPIANGIITESHPTTETTLISQIEQMDPDKLAQGIRAFVTLTEHDNDGNWIKEFDFSAAHDSVAPLLPTTAPRTLKLHDSQSILTAVYLCAAVEQKCRRYEDIQLKRVKVALSPLLDSKGIEHDAYRALNALIEKNHPLSTLSIERQLTALANAEAFEFQYQHGENSHFSFNDGEHALHFSLPFQTINQCLMHLSYRHVVKRWDNEPFPIHRWQTAFTHSRNEDLYQLAKPERIQASKKTLSALTQPDFRLHYPNPFISNDNIVNCSQCHRPPAVFTDKMDDMHLFEIHCPNCNDVENLSCSGTLLDVQKTLAQWTLNHRDKLHIKYTSIHSINEIAMARRSINLELKHAIEYLNTYSQIKTEHSRLDSTYLKQFDLSKPSDNYIQSLNIHLLWAETLLTILDERASVKLKTNFK